MQRIIDFLIKNSVTFLFLGLFGLGFGLTIQSHSYHRSQFINSANEITGGLYSVSNKIIQYSNLKTENEKLIDENLLLTSQLHNLNIDLDSINTSELSVSNNFIISKATVYKNSYTKLDNYITINVGRKDGVKQDFGVITSKGIIGIVENTSKNYARVLSILSKKSSINAQLKSSNHFGSLQWDGKSTEYAVLNDVSKFSKIKKGDTIITGGQSAIFPKGIPIGTIESFDTDISGNTYVIAVKLFNDMTDISTVYVLNNTHKTELEQLQNSANE